MYYVGLENAELSIERVAIREQAGGHGIPEKDLRRRYVNSLDNLKKVLPLCDSVHIYDNSGRDPFDILNPLLVVKNSNIVIWRESCPQYLKEVLKSYLAGLKYDF